MSGAAAPVGATSLTGHASVTGAATREPRDVIEALDSDAANGLSSEEAAARLAATGPNELDDEPVQPRWRLFLRQFASTMIIVLLVAAVITMALGEWRDAGVIIAILVLNAAIGYVQEIRAEQAMTALRDMSSPLARVVRDGQSQEIPARDVVPGDLIALEAGDLVPADARLVDSPALRVVEAALTGESVPVDKTVSAVPGPDPAVADQTSMVFRGTAVVHGNARAVVVTTGMNTALGGIAELLRTSRPPPTPLQRRLASLGRWLAAAAVFVCAIVFALGMFRGEDTLVMFLTAVSLAVAAIPEALPAVVTIALALGAQRMARRHALMRRLPAVETLGSVTVICTDKTGTLTQGRMQVERVWTADGEVTIDGSGYSPEGALTMNGAPITAEHPSVLASLILAGALCNDATLVAPDTPDDDWDVAGDPTEGALLTLAARAGVDAAAHRVGDVPFDAERRRMTTANTGDGVPDGTVLISTKGAVESVLEVADRIATAGGPQPLDQAARDQVVQRAESYAASGYRVLAIAGRTEPGKDEPEADDLETDLTLYGLVAMADPPRPESEAAVRACQAAGIRPIMITGDHPATASAIARRLGMDGADRVMTGAMLRELTTAGRPIPVTDVSIYARIAPDQKLDIVSAWQDRGDVVAMTGDGVNDAPALRQADIGIAMGQAGTEVAREAAAMVLTDDNFATIIAAIEEGRRIYDNIRRFVRYTLTSNSGEIWVMLIGPLLGLPLPLVAVQILWINLVTDGLPGLALGVEPAERGVLQRPPRPPAESVFTRGMWQHILGMGLFMGAIPLALGVWASQTGRPWQTMVFTSLALLQLGNALAVRSERESLRQLGLRTNAPLLWSVVGTLVLQLAVVYSAWGQALFHTQPLSAADLGIVLAASTLVFIAVEVEKAVRRAVGTPPRTPLPA
jgi:P-type Ca2+ transporter type 2C